MALLHKKKTLELETQFLEFRQTVKRKRKIKKWEGTFGYWLVKFWLKKFHIDPAKAPSATNPLNLDIINSFQPFSSKTFWVNEILYHMNDLSEELINHVLPNVKRVHSFHSGEYFGEIAFLRKEPRTATIICSETTEIAVITRKYEEDFLLIYKE